MKHQSIQSILIFVFIGVLISSACADNSSQPQDEQAVRKLDNMERLAVLEGDIATLKKLWSKDFMVNNPQNFISSNRDTVIHFVKNAHISYARFDRNIEEIRFFNDIAIVMGSETAAPKVNVDAPSLTRRFTNVWQKSGDTWQMISRHANTIICSEDSN